ncbi:uncharacterized protein LOC125818879 [Solanum verrucosum]|uniref:uncharacterized protein LOC125818879 n=1 Tax=Solanum verrucosum TaxID=315347 RepID=UPI0020D0A1D1|nr:uncharacterized protein LOC125818879 [Solanum verrucosum]
MGHLANSADVRASRLELAVPGIIERALTTTLIALRYSIDPLTTSILVCEIGQGPTHEVMVLKAAIAELRKDVDQLMSTNMSMIFGTVEIPEDLGTYIPVYSDVPPAPTEDEVRSNDVVTEFDAETIEEQHGSSGGNEDETQGTDAQPRV